MEKIKKISFGITIILSFSLYQYFCARQDYSWHENYLAQKENNWIVRSMHANVVDPVHIYSFFKSPVVRIGLIEKKSLIELSSNIYYVKTLWVSKDVGAREINEEENICLVDCTEYKHVCGEEKVNDSLNFDINNIDFGRTYKENEEYKIIFEKECEIIDNYLK